MKVLVVGLGNPGYDFTRHNVGADVLDYVCSRQGVEKKNLEKNLWFVRIETIGSFEFFCCIRPSVMNSSGQRVSDLFKSFKCEQLIVVADDLDLEFGVVKTKFGTSARGHKGVKSLLGIVSPFWWIRVGIDRPESRDQVTEYVLERLSSQEKSKIPIIANEVEIELMNIFIALKENGSRS